MCTSAFPSLHIRAFFLCRYNVWPLSVWSGPNLEEQAHCILTKLRVLLAEKEVVPGHWICPFHLGPSLYGYIGPCGAVVWHWRVLLVKFLPLRSGLGPSAKEAEAPKSYRVWEFCSVVRPIILSHSEAALAVLFFFFKKTCFYYVKFSLLIKFYIGVQLISNVVLVSGVQ